MESSLTKTSSRKACPGHCGYLLVQRNVQGILTEDGADEASEEMHLTDDDEQDLRARVDQMPGCLGLGNILAQCGVLTSEQLGTISDKRYHQTLAYIPQKRVDVPGDLQDPKRYGPGHLNSLDELRKQARAEVQARKRARAPRDKSYTKSVGMRS